MDATELRLIDMAATEVRPANAADVEGVARLFAGVIRSLPYYTEEAKLEEIAALRAEEIGAMVGDRGALLLVSTLSRNLTGACLLRRNEGGVWWLTWIVTDPGFRGRRVASALIAEAKRLIRNAGGHKIWCDCRTTNEPSRKMLAHNGFLSLCEINNHWYKQDFILWELSL
ncbi:MAG TPA: GNAT family N-acetyltransferase [Candidatus Saccharimonadales bacterium]|jgi:ribosomal protein S18 acetylase RimI-like enzyme|nr:GNAT family N-acetyltransferase [Candidatus Saccharimonadales bacterium]